MKQILQIFLIILFPLFLFAQNTVGLLSYNPSQAFDGYNLIYPHNQPNVYLIDMCGEIVHTWEGDPDTRPGNMVYLLDDGRIVKSLRPASIAGNPIWAGGGGATIEIRDWDNNLEWSYTLNDAQKRLHHDFTIIEKNGIFSIAMIAWELKTEQEAWEAGRDTTTTAQDKMWPDHIIEIEPATNQIIWEWHAWDHLVQDIDANRDNFGSVSDNPQKIDINYDFGDGHPDWMHANALDWDHINDLLILTVPRFNEVWIIDHTTTTAQAAGSTGGSGLHGGDLLYRWGNPLAYKSGTVEDQKLFYPHDGHFINEFLPPFDPNFNKIGVFNNRVGEDFSTINILDADFDMYKFSYPFDGTTFGPSNFDYTGVHPIDSSLMHSTGLSSFQMLPNGNRLVDVGRYGYLFEMTPEDEIVWEYKVPINGGAFANQGDTLDINNNLTFRVQRIPTDYEAFDGKDVSQKGWLELNPDSTFCDIILPTNDLIDMYSLNVYPNPASKMITIEWDAGIYIDMDVVDILGRQMISPMRLSGGRKYLDTSDWVNGMYFVRINNRAILKVNIIH